MPFARQMGMNSLMNPQLLSFYRLMPRRPGLLRNLTAGPEVDFAKSTDPSGKIERISDNRSRCPA
jgi:hypothetical protein